MQVFLDRADAGRQLADVLATHPAVASSTRVVVLAIPRGGLPVGAEVARRLGAEFDVAVVRKLRSPHNAELGFGAVGPGGHVELDEGMVARLGLTGDQIAAEIADRRAAVERRLSMYRELVPEADVRDATVVVVDDGIATGGTARQACSLARHAGAATVVLAAPVGPRRVTQDLADAADAIVVLSTPAEFLAVGQAYQDFAQMDDEQTRAALERAMGVS
jgi:putative phosphoribosyl transferase